MPRIRASQLVAIVTSMVLLLFQQQAEIDEVRVSLGIKPIVPTQLLAVPAVPVAAQRWQAIVANNHENDLWVTSSSVTEYPKISAKSVYVEDLESESILLSVNETTQLPPASTQKLMTALVALESLTPETVLTVQSSDIQWSNILDFTVGEQFVVEDLLKSLLIVSSNEAAEVLAREYPGGYQAFITRMNEKAIELGLVDTSFRNPTGYDAVGQYSSAKDLHLLSSQAMRNPLIKAIVKEPLLIISDVTGTRKHVLKSTNQLLEKNLGAVGIKTGTTELAGEVLITQFHLDVHQLRIILMGSSQRYEDTQAVLEWIMKTYVWIKPSDLINAI